MSKEKIKIELTEEQLEKIAGGYLSCMDGTTKCPRCGKNADCMIYLPEWTIGDIWCHHCNYGSPV